MTWPYVIFLNLEYDNINSICYGLMNYQYFTWIESYMYNKRRPELVIFFNIVATIFIGIYILIFNSNI